MKRKRKATIIERVEIVERETAREVTFNGLIRDGYRIVHSGPYTTKAMFPKVDPHWFMLTAERVVK